MEPCVRDEYMETRLKETLSKAGPISPKRSVAGSIITSQLGAFECQNVCVVLGVLD